MRTSRLSPGTSKMADGLPKTRQAAALIDGQHTDLVCSSFEDRILIVVTQFGKFGTLISASKDGPLLSDNPSNSQKGNTFTTKVLMGKDETIWHVYAQQIAALITEETSKPVLLSIALKKHSPQILQCILGLLRQNRVW